jgi:cytochrome c oxidase assembly factor CtaG
VGAWSFQPPLVLVAVGGYLYLLGGRGRVGASRPRHELWRSLSFGAGLATVVIALGSPVDAYADGLFFVHMTQHVLLLTVAPPLLLLGAPWTRMWRPLPLGFRRGAARRLVVDRRTRLLRAAATRLASPVVAWLAFGVNLVLWHVPALYDATLRSQWIHDLEHALFFTTALVFWAQVIPSPPFRARLGELARAAYVTSAMLVGWVLAVVLAFARAPLYRPYVELAHHPLGLSPLADQQIAAGVMWVPGSLAFTIAALVFLCRWMAAESATRTKRPLLVH